MIKEVSSKYQFSGHPNRVDINRVYAQLREYSARYYCLYGSRRSGKSYAISQLLCLRAIEGRRRIAVLRKFATTLRLSCWSRVIAALSEMIPGRFSVNKAERSIILFNDSEIVMIGADDSEKLKSLEEITDVWLEEATEFAASDFHVLDAGLSTRCDPPPCLWLSFNPIPTVPGYQHWLQDRFLFHPHEMSIPVQHGNVVILKTWYKDNAFCPTETRLLLESYQETNPSLYAMWALGNFTQLEGCILSDWDVVPQVPPETRFIGYGLDFGFSQDACAVVGVWRAHRELYVKEYVYATGLTNYDLSAAMTESGIRRGIDDIIADSAEPKSIEELQRLGWIIRPSQKGRDFKRAAALYLRGHTIHATADSPNLRRELATWCWRQDKNGNPLPLVSDGNDHAIDSLIYRIFRPGGSIPYDAIRGSREDLSTVPKTIISDDIKAIKELDYV